MRKDKWPELPSGYRYDSHGERIYLLGLVNGTQRYFLVPGTTKRQYWRKPEYAALFAWKQYAFTLQKAFADQKEHI